MKFDISFGIIHMDKKELLDMKSGDIGLQRVAVQSKILFSSILSFTRKLFHIACTD